MVVHGIEISENMDIKDILSLFNSLIVASENTKNELADNFERYKSLHTLSSDGIEKFESLLKTINGLQINSSKAYEGLENLSEKITEKEKALIEKFVKENTALLSQLKGEIKSIEDVAQNAINKAVKGVKIDTSSISEAINKKVASFDISKLAELIETTNENMDRAISGLGHGALQVENINTVLKNSFGQLGKSIEKIDSATAQNTKTADAINRSIKKINPLLALGGFLVGGILTGSLVYLNSHIVYDSLFKEKEEAILKSLKEDYVNKSEMIDLFKNMKVSIKKMSDGRRYIFVPNKNTTEAYSSVNGNGVIILD